MDYDRMDRIYIRDLLVRAIVGINPDERVNKQDVVLNVVLYADFRDAAASDDIARTVDYKALKKDLIAWTEASSYGLIETLADRAAAFILERDGVAACRVTVDKPAALRFARSVAAEVFRTRPVA
jgi:FolB domain-containing protein